MSPVDRIDELYGLPLEQFTPARDALARELRAGGERATAEEVKRLRKPGLPAWALNQIRRQKRGRVDQLIDAGQRLRDAQKALLAGGQRGLLADAAAAERRLVEELLADAQERLREAGHPASTGHETRIRGTLHAVAVDPEARELLAQGRLVGDYVISDLGLFGAGAAPAPAGREPRAPSSRAPDAAPPKQDKAAARKHAATARQQAAAARKAAAIRKRLERAREREQVLRQDAQQAQRQAEQAQRQAERAEAKATTAAAGVAKLEAELENLPAR